MSDYTSTSAARELNQRAKAALELGLRESLALFDQAIRVDPGNAELWLGKARALELNGDLHGARIVAQQLSDQAPSFLAAHALLAQLRLAAQDQDFTSHYEVALRKHPRNPNILAAQCEVLAGLDFAAEAMSIAARARQAFPEEAHFELLEAVHAGAAGQWDRAEQIFATMEVQSPDRKLQEARHRIRGQQPERADALLADVLLAWPWDIAAWALYGIVWRLVEDPRAEWLHEQAGLVQLRPLECDPIILNQATDTLRILHANSSQPLGQSLRGGSQTRGILLERAEPGIRVLRQAIHDTLHRYRSNLPAADGDHPTLRHRDARWGLAGSWSVRLTGGGDHHTAHIHPQGIISSALYLAVPATSAEATGGGQLEIGRPPTDLDLDLPPLETIKPKPGHLALFPSTLYHGTTAFSSGERLTVAFDVVATDVPIS